MKAAKQAQEDFIARFAQKALPDDLPLQHLQATDASGLRLANALKESGLVASNSEASRKLAEGAVRIDGNKVTDREQRLVPGPEYILQLGPRRFARVSVTPAS
jgi:tyrosyl-tRNA synthetase